MNFYKLMEIFVLVMWTNHDSWSGSERICASWLGIWSMTSPSQLGLVQTSWRSSIGMEQQISQRATRGGGKPLPPPGTRLTVLYWQWFKVVYFLLMRAAQSGAVLGYREPFFKQSGSWVIYWCWLVSRYLPTAHIALYYDTVLPQDENNLMVLNVLYSKVSCFTGGDCCFRAVIAF